MSAALIAACLWVCIACVLGLMPSRDHHWRVAYGLIAVGIPILGWVTLTLGPVWGLAVLAAGASILRWPLIRVWRRVRRALARDKSERQRV